MAILKSLGVDTLQAKTLLVSKKAKIESNILNILFSFVISWPKGSLGPISIYSAGSEISV